MPRTYMQMLTQGPLAANLLGQCKALTDNGMDPTEVVRELCFVACSVAMTNDVSIEDAYDVFLTQQQHEEEIKMKAAQGVPTA